MKKKIVVLDAETFGKDLDLSPLFSVGDVTVFDNTVPKELPGKIVNADVLVLNKVKITREALQGNTSVSLICVFATGYDNIDVDYCQEHNIAVCNVVGYSTDSVAQLTIAMALSLWMHLPEYNAHVSSGKYSAGGIANCLTPVYQELCGKTWGIIGYGHIGSKVAKVASTMGCRILTHKRTLIEGVDCVDLDTLCRESDIISIHTPLNESTRNLIGKKQIEMMKPTAIVINVSRGAVWDESAMAEAIVSHKIAGIACDVYSLEPMPKNHPFFDIKSFPNVCLTPHMAWGAYEARVRCLDEIVQNIIAFEKGIRRNRVC